MVVKGDLRNKRLFSYGINDLGLIKAVKLTKALVLGMRNHSDANDCFQTISFELESLSHNFYSVAKLVYFL